MQSVVMQREIESDHTAVELVSDTTR